MHYNTGYEIICFSWKKSFNSSLVKPFKPLKQGLKAGTDYRVKYPKCSYFVFTCLNYTQKRSLI